MVRIVSSCPELRGLSYLSMVEMVFRAIEEPTIARRDQKRIGIELGRLREWMNVRIRNR
jgi:hypothetical protein